MSQSYDMLSSEEEDEGDPIDIAFAQIISGQTKKTETPQNDSTQNIFLKPVVPKIPPFFGALPPLPVLGGTVLPPLPSKVQQCSSPQIKSVDTPKADNVHRKSLSICTKNVKGIMLHEDFHIFDPKSVENKDVSGLNTSSDSSTSGSESDGGTSSFSRDLSCKPQKGSYRSHQSSSPTGDLVNHQKEFTRNYDRRKHDDGRSLHVNNLTPCEDHKANGDEIDSQDPSESKLDLFESLRQFDRKENWGISSSQSDGDSSDSSSSSDEDTAEPTHKHQVTNGINGAAKGVCRSSGSDKEEHESGECSSSDESNSYLAETANHVSSNEKRTHSYSHSSSDESDTTMRNRQTSLRKRLGLTPVKKRLYEEYRYDHKEQRETSIPPNFNPRTPPEEDYDPSKHSRPCSRTSSMSSNGFREYYDANYDYKQNSDYSFREYQNGTQRPTNQTTPPPPPTSSPNWLEMVKNPETLRSQYLKSRRSQEIHWAPPPPPLPPRPEPESPARPNLESRIRGLLGNKTSSSEESPIKKAVPDLIIRPKMHRPLHRPPSPFLHRNAYLFWYKETYLFKKNNKIGTYPCADPTVKRKIGIQIKNSSAIQKKSTSSDSKNTSFTPIHKRRLVVSPTMPKAPLTNSDLPLPIRLDSKPIIVNGLTTKIGVAPQTELELTTESSDCSVSKAQSAARNAEIVLESVKLRILQELKESMKRNISEILLNSLFDSLDPKRPRTE